MKSEILKYALYYETLGFSVIPVGRDKKPLIDWKKYQSEKATKEQIESWWKQFDNPNVGIVTGKISGITVVDVEKSGSVEGLPPTVISKTGGGGWHFYYKYLEVGNKTRIRELTDIRGDGGFVVAPPSIHASGNTYEWSVSPEDADMADFPTDLLPSNEGGYVTPLRISDYVELPEGQRNDGLHKLACSLLVKYPEYQAWEFILATNRTYKPPLPEEEVKNLFDSARTFHLQNHKTNAVVPPATNERLRGKSKNRKAVVSRLSDIQPEQVEWLWIGRIALGKLTMISGDPGLGKSLLTTTLAAHVSRGFPWPVDKTEPQVGDVILLSAEDDAADTIRPRLDAAQADCTRIHILEAIQEVTNEGETFRTMFSFREDLKALEELLKSLPDCKLLVVDPVSAYLGGTDSHKNSDIRALFAPLADLAARHKIAVVMISHLNKGAGGNAMYRTMGTLAFVAAVRAAYIVTKDQENPTRRLFMPVKNNLAEDTGGLAYSISAAENGSPVITWESQSISITADEALALPELNEERTATDEAFDFLRELLASRPMKATDVKKYAKQAGINEKPLRKAREKLGVKPKKSDFSSGWVWALPGEDAQDAQDAHAKDRASWGVEGILGSRGHLGRRREKHQ